MEQYKQNIISNEEMVKISMLYIVDFSKAIEVSEHNGGKNHVYLFSDMVIRISNHYNYQEYLAEAEFVHYLYTHKASCVDVIYSSNHLLVEEVNDKIIVAFTRALGDTIASHGYKYIDGAPLSDYFINTGKLLGQIHQLSKEYKPITHRYDFFDKYNEEYINSLKVDDLIKCKILSILNEVKKLPRNDQNYGLIHFDFNDGNYHINYDNGDITLFDFDNCCNFFYMYDLADTFVNGFGWVMFEDDVNKRCEFMKKYFGFVLEGYKNKTSISESELAMLSLFIKVVLVENIIDYYESNLGQIIDEEQRYRFNILMNDVDYFGFFDDSYDPCSPFELEEEIN